MKKFEYISTNIVVLILFMAVFIFPLFGWKSFGEAQTYQSFSIDPVWQGRDCMYYLTINNRTGDCAIGQEWYADENCVLRCYWPAEYLDAEFPNHWENRNIPFEDDYAIFFKDGDFIAVDDWIGELSWSPQTVYDWYFEDTDNHVTYDMVSKTLTIVVGSDITIIVKHAEKEGSE